MSFTVDRTNEISGEFQTETFSNEATTTPTGRNPASAAGGIILAYKVAVIVIGVLGTLTNGLVLVGFWLSGRSKMTSHSVHIANHTTLELQSPFSWLGLGLSSQIRISRLQSHPVLGCWGRYFLDLSQSLMIFVFPTVLYICSRICWLCLLDQNFNCRHISDQHLSENERFGDQEWFILWLWRLRVCHFLDPGAMRNVLQPARLQCTLPWPRSIWLLT